MTINLENFRECVGEQGIEAVFDVYLPNIQLTLRNIKLMISRKNLHFLRFPSFVEGQDVEGNKIFSKVFEFSKERMKSFEDTIFLELGKVVKSPLRRWESQ